MIIKIDHITHTQLARLLKATEVGVSNFQDKFSEAFALKEAKYDHVVNEARTENKLNIVIEIKDDFVLLRDYADHVFDALGFLPQIQSIKDQR